MEKVIKLGRQRPNNLDIERGEVYQHFHLQPFQYAVSHEHATIPIDDNGSWWLTDMESTNGTYIRKDDEKWWRYGNDDAPDFRRVQYCAITPMTFIRLGCENSNSISFYAKQAEKYGDFDKDFEYIKERKDSLLQEKELKIKRIKRISLCLEIYLPIIISLLIVVLGFLGGRLELGGGIGTALFLILNRMPKLIYNSNKKQEELISQIDKRIQSISFCPNPECSNQLTRRQIDNMRCDTCGIQHN